MRLAFGSGPAPVTNSIRCRSPAPTVGGVTFTLGEVLAFGTFWLGRAMLDRHDLGVRPGVAGVLRAVRTRRVQRRMRVRARRNGPGPGGGVPSAATTSR